MGEGEGMGMSVKPYGELSRYKYGCYAGDRPVREWVWELCRISKGVMRKRDV